MPSLNRSSRRKFLQGCAAAGAVSLLPAREINARAAQSRGPNIVVVGAGAFGGWTALHLLRSGARVTLVDVWGPGNSRASSGGETRVIRATYGKDKVYTQLVARAFVLWREAEKQWKRQIFFPRGVLWMSGKDDSFERESIPHLKDAGIPFEMLTPMECARRWPQIDFHGITGAILEPKSGYLLARQSCELVMETFRAEGGTYQQAHARPLHMSAGRLANLDLGKGKRLEADQFVFACGPWLASVLPGMEQRITPTRQEVFYFGTPAGDTRFDEENLPVWADNGAQLFYGIPGNRYRGFKIADDTRGDVIDPTAQERQVSARHLAAARTYIARRFPAMRGAPLVESRVCQYENSPDSHFQLDRWGEAQNVWVLGGGSGHGFKHGPALGELAAKVVLGKATPPPEFLAK